MRSRRRRGPSSWRAIRASPGGHTSACCACHRRRHLHEVATRMSFADSVRARLRGLYATDDPRIDWLPDRPDAAEAHLRLDGSCDLVIGYTGTRFPELDVFVERCAAHA